MQNLSGRILGDSYLYDQQFNTKEATKMIVKSRPIKGKYLFLQPQHSETYFVSEDNEVLYISFHSALSRVDIFRIYWSNQDEKLSYTELINKFTEAQNEQNEQWGQYNYSKEYDLTKQTRRYQFIELQEFAREYASTPYTLTLSNCNYATNWLIKKINPEFKSEINYYGNYEVSCAIF